MDDYAIGILHFDALHHLPKKDRLTPRCARHLRIRKYLLIYTELDILRGELHTVMELNPLSEVERPGEPVTAHFPLIGQPVVRGEISFRGGAHQSGHTTTASSRWSALSQRRGQGPHFRSTVAAVFSSPAGGAATTG